MEVSPVLDSRVGVGVSQPGGPGTPAVIGLVDVNKVFWPETEVSFCSKGFIATADPADDSPQDWSYVLAEGPDEEREARAKMLARRTAE